VAQLPLALSQGAFSCVFAGCEHWIVRAFGDAMPSEQQKSLRVVVCGWLLGCKGGCLPDRLTSGGDVLCGIKLLLSACISFVQFSAFHFFSATLTAWFGSLLSCFSWRARFLGSLLALRFWRAALAGEIARLFLSASSLLGELARFFWATLLGGQLARPLLVEYVRLPGMWLCYNDVRADPSPRGAKLALRSREDCDAKPLKSSAVAPTEAPCTASPSTRASIQTDTSGAQSLRSCDGRRLFKRCFMLMVSRGGRP